jgi:mevalonate kinase
LHTVTVSAPGKLILVGEHAAVYRRPALVAALGPRLHVSLETVPGNAVELLLSHASHREVATWPAILDYARSVRDEWQRFVQNPSVDGFGQLRGGGPARLVKIALGETAGWAADASPPGLRVRVGSDLPVGAGLGSSAALAVALIHAYLLVRNLPCDARVVEQLALEVERRQHGTPSGIDTATVLRGGVLWSEARPDGGLQLEPVDLRSSVSAVLRLYDTGSPAEPTGTVVAAVRERVGRNAAAFESAFERMEQATRRLRRLLCAGTESEADTATGVLQSICTYERGLESLGVVPEPVQRLIRRIERHGGAANKSGAGALTGSAAGQLLV